MFLLFFLFCSFFRCLFSGQIVDFIPHVTQLLPPFVFYAKLVILKLIDFFCFQNKVCLVYKNNARKKVQWIIAVIVSKSCIWHTLLYSEKWFPTNSGSQPAVVPNWSATNYWNRHLFKIKMLLWVQPNCSSTKQRFHEP